MVDRNGIGRKHRAALRRIIALLLALADLAERACGRSRPVRWLVLLILGVAEARARDYVAGLTGIPASALTMSMPIEQGDRVADAKNLDSSVARALWLASAFRLLSAILAAALATLPDDATIAARTNLFAAKLRSLIAPLPVAFRDTS